MAKKTGRPPKWDNVEELDKAIDKYFDDCAGHPFVQEDGSVLYGKDGLPVIVGATPPTMSGLALALGFVDRRSLLDYEGKSRFSRSIARARTKLETYAESRLYDRDGARGAEFSLKYNFKWAQEEQEKQAAAQGVVILPAIMQQDEGKEDG